MNLAIAIILLWLAAALIWVAAHGTTAKTPWQAFKQITDAIGKTGEGDSEGTPTTSAADVA